MSNVLIRDVPTEDLERIRAAAAERGMSLQGYLRETLHEQARYLRRQEALERVATHLADRPAVPESERQAVLDEIDAEQASRGEELGRRAAR